MRLAMRIVLFGATGAIGRCLVPLLREAGHEIFAVTRSAARADDLGAIGVIPIIADALNAHEVYEVIAAASPEAVIHQLTDLAARDYSANARLRTIGTRNIVDAASRIGVRRMVAQSIAWTYLPGPTSAKETDPIDSSYPGVTDLELAVGEIENGIVLRYGLLYGPGTWYSYDGENGAAARRGELTANADVSSFVHVEDAARAAIAALEWPAAIVNIVDDEPAPANEWMHAFATVVDAPTPIVPAGLVQGRPVSSGFAHTLGWTPLFPTWRTGFTSLRPER